MESCNLNSSFFNAFVNNYLLFFLKPSEHLQTCEVHLKISRCLEIKKVVSGWELFLCSFAAG